MLKALLLAAFGAASCVAALPTLGDNTNGATPSAQTINASRQLGELLFSDPRLSGNGTTSCATCHQPDRHFTDGLPVAVGATGQKLTRNTPTLLNASNFASYGWTNDGVVDLATQHLQPLTNTTPIEMGFDDKVLVRLPQDAKLIQLRSQAFPTSTGFSLANITQALAAYVASLEYRSAFDDYLRFDDTGALTESAKRGLALFTSERLGCAGCHQGPLLGGGWRDGKTLHLPAVYVVRPVAGSNLKLRTPSLRAVAHTSPYMVDGRLPSLTDVLDFYETAEPADLSPFQLTATARQDLLNFLRSL